VVPTTDTIHVAHDDKFIEGTQDRNGLYNGQKSIRFNIALLKKL
jgi:2-C-methyl-D-erythritol 4-phosphate cytidylyltransferase